MIKTNTSLVKFIYKTFSSFGKLPKAILICGSLLSFLLIAQSMISIFNTPDDFIQNYRLISNYRETIIVAMQSFTMTTLASLGLQYFFFRDDT